MKELHNARVSLALHLLQASQDEDSSPLLLLYALGGSAQDFAAAPPAWRSCSRRVIPHPRNRKPSPGKETTVAAR